MSNRAVDILYQAKQNEIEIVLNDGQLHLKLPKNKTFDRAIIDEIKASKQSIIDFLKNNKKDVNTYTQIEPFNRQAISRIPLSFSQERLWFVDKKSGSVQYHSPSVLRLQGKLDVPALEHALQQIVERHQVLRSVFVQEGGQVYQHIQSSHNWQLIKVDGAAFKEQTLQQYIHQCISKPFDLATDFMLRAVLIQLSSEEHMLVVTMHHIASDAWSLSVLVKEVAELYSAYTNRRQAALAPLTLQYADYAVWQRNQLQPAALNKKLDYWKQKLDGVATLQMPSDTLRAGTTEGYGASSVFKIDKVLSDQLHALSRREGTSLYMTLLAVFNVLLYRYSGQPDICVGTSVANRQQQELEGLVGFFVNTLALRNQVSGEVPFTALLHQVRTTTLEAYDHLDVPFEKVVEAVVKERVAGINPLFQVMLVLHNTPEVSQLQLGEVTLSGEPYESELTKFDLTFFVTETADGLQVLAQYNAHLFSNETIGQMAEHFTALLSAIVKFPEEKIGLLPMLGEEEQQRLLSINRKDIYYPKDKTVIDLFEEQVLKTPDATAVVFEKKQLTFAELNAKANQLAHCLRQKGIRENSLVPLYIERGLHLLTGILGIMKAGAAYVPIDTDLPADRIAFMLEDTGASVIVSSSNSRSKLSAIATIEMVEIDGTELTTQSTENPQTSLTAQHPAYVIYTSGSTGNPKGVIIQHRSLVDYVFGLNESTQISKCCHYALVSTIATDLGNTVIFSSLLLGGALHVFVKEAVSNAAYLHHYFGENSIDCLKIVPSHWKALSPDDNLLLPAKLLVFGGEALPADYINTIQETGANCTIVNHYGPTETTIGKLLHVVDKERKYEGTIPIGKPFSNTQVYVLTKQLQLCPTGVLGQLYIGGDGLAKGYLNNVALTNQKFIANPFEPGKASLLYATGDLVKYSSDGNILFAGRIDNQVKIRGYRVEVGEVENTLRQCNLVQQAVIVAKDDKQANKRLIAYVVPADYFDREGITAFLQEKLPEYMVPSMLVELESLPLTANGKVNYKALPDPETSEQLINKYVAPQNDTQKSLAAIWEEVLEVEQVGIHDDFFELGGHSLLAIRLISAIRKSMGTEVSIGAVFDYSTIAGLSTQLGQPADADVLPAVIPIQPRPDEIPLSFSQERLWFIHQMDGSVQYHIPAVLRLKGHLNRVALSNALQTIINRHEVLRTVVRPNNGQPYQYIKAGGEWQMAIINGADYKEDNTGLQAYIANLINQPFDLTMDDMLRAHLICFAADDNLLVLTLHHIASDGWSRSVLVEELAELYNAYQEGENTNLKALPVQYADYSIWQRTHLQGNVLEHKLGYWKEKLSGVQALEFPTDFARPLVRSNQGAVCSFTIDKDLSKRLQDVSHRHGVTLYMTLLSVFKILLYRYTGQQDICVGTPVAGRQQAELEGLVGFFINSLALRTQVDGNCTFLTLLQQVKTTTLEAFSHQELPFEKVVELVVKERDMSRSPLFQVMFVLQNTPEAADFVLNNLQVSREGIAGYHTSKFDFSFFVTEVPDGLSISVEYSTELFKEATISRMAAHYSNLLQAVTTQPEQLISSLPIMTVKETNQLLAEFNHTITAYPADKTIIALFEEQVAQSPNAVAVVFENKQLSYAALNEQANQLAHYLKSKGIKAETLVPVCMERSVDLIIAILGILKAGAAYVPINPAYPADRIGFMLQDIAAGLVLCSKEAVAKLPSTKAIEVIVLDENQTLITQQPATNLPIEITASQLAYIIYTSGSTGTPKGVLVQHSNVVSLVKGIDYVHFSNHDVLLSTGSPSFDATTFEYWGMLLNGGRLVLCTEERLLNSATLKAAIRENAVTKMWFTASWFNQLADTDIAVFEGLQTLLAGGEKLSEQHIRKVQQRYPLLEIINGYGPTENTTFSLTHKISHQDTAADTTIPIGRPLSNRTAYVLDAQQQLVPAGITGEICLGGAGLSRGYLNQPQLTKEKFIYHAFGEEQAIRLYKTGDMGRWLPNGTIEYQGRKDEQVKIRGYRIETGEIETVLQQSGLVQQSVVVAREDAAGTKRLTGYVVAESFNREAITTYLQTKLPEYMVPNVWVEMERLPLTANGKVDKKSLPDADASAQLTNTYTAPQTETEATLAAIWQELLRIDKAGIHDNFFELGGHSLMAMRVVTAIEKSLSVSVPIKVLFQFTTISKLSKYLELQTAAKPDAPAKNYKLLDI